MGIVLSRNDVPSNAFDDYKGYDKADDKEDTRIDHYMEEVTVIFWRVAVGGTIVLVAHVK